MKKDSDSDASQGGDHAPALSRRKVITRAAQIGGLAILGKVSDVVAQTHSELLPSIDTLPDTSKALGTRPSRIAPLLSSSEWTGVLIH